MPPAAAFLQTLHDEHPEPQMLPVQRKTHSQTRQGRSHDGLTAKQSASCPNCGDTKLPHRACRNCGYVRPGLSVKAHRTNQGD